MSGCLLYSKTENRRAFLCQKKNLGRAKTLTKYRQKVLETDRSTCTLESTMQMEKNERILYTSLNTDNWCSNKSSASFLCWIPMPKDQDLGSACSLSMLTIDTQNKQTQDSFLADLFSQYSLVEFYVIAFTTEQGMRDGMRDGYTSPHIKGLSQDKTEFY